MGRLERLLRPDTGFVLPRKGGIWSERDKAYLIDSIINGFDIPKFYLSDFGMRSSTLRPEIMFM